jgi:hypothetical protein
MVARSAAKKIRKGVVAAGADRDAEIRFCVQARSKLSKEVTILTPEMIVRLYAVLDAADDGS